MDYNFNFTGKIALVLGGSRGIGKCLVDNLRKHNCLVYYTCTKNINSKYIYQYDAIQPNSLREIYRDLDSKSIDIDFVINCLGIGSSKRINEISEHDWENIMKINLQSYFISCKEAIKRMKKRNFGKIINIS